MVSDIRQGEVYWIDFGPVGGSAPAYRHPCVVVQNDIFNRSLISTTVVCLITSNLKRGDAPGNVRLSPGEANLPKNSVVNVSQLATVNKTDLAGSIGTLSAGTLQAVCRGLALLFERV